LSRVFQESPVFQGFRESLVFPVFPVFRVFQESLV
jgi:hypothetical protein